MKSSKGTFEGLGKLKLFYQVWVPEQTPRAAIVIIHGGNGDHSSRYKNVVNHFVPCNYAIYTFDQRGSGQSLGHRGHIKHWKEFREDLAMFLNFVYHEQPNLPIYIFGHSLGGVTVLDYCIRNPKNIRGIICSAPAIGEINISPFLWTVARFLNQVWPSIPISTGLDMSKTSRDSAEVQATLNDPYMHGKGTPRLAMQLNETVDWIHSHANEFSLPLLILHGTKDEFASIEGSRKFINNVAYHDAELKEYDGGYHELFRDTIKQQVFNDIEEWLSQHE
ncbi:alpha/beta hydrolase [Candidatus Latescibacterota bacterium]